MKTLKDEPILLALVAIILAFAALWAVGCGSGGTTYATTPTAPTTTPAAAAPATPTVAATVSIVGTTGSTSFTPNPVQAAVGATMAFKNNTSVAHHIVMDDGTVIGDIAPGATVNATVKGGNYHCTTHPTMVGSINGAAAPPDPTPNPSGGYDY